MKPRRWLSMWRFSLRDLLALILLCAISVGWWADHREQLHEMQRQQEHAQRQKMDLESQLRFLRAYNRNPVPNARGRVR